MSLNILFLTYHEVTHQKGGIERMTDVVVNDLLNREGFCCYSAYYYPNKLEHTIFSDKLCLERGNEYRQLARFIEDNGINVLVNQQIYTLDNVLAKESQPLCAAVFRNHTVSLSAHHFVSDGYFSEYLHCGRS